ncbi:MAG: DMT family transporter [Spirochaetia bacterium]|jgi:drug/metabolite transporter (DMT)-like permease|nr:DMT family transporter [Spirochaetia bacterium]
MVTSKRVAILLATATAIIWGLSFLSIKIAVTVVPPMSLGLARFVIATILFMLFFAAKRSLPRLALRDLPLMAGSGLIGVTLYFAGENNGIMLLSASESSIIVGTIPVLTVVADRLFTGARLRALQYSGAIISVMGVSLMVVESLKISAQPMGYLYMGIAALAWVAYAFATRPMLAKYSQTEVTFWQGLFGALGFLPFALLESMDWAGLTPLIIMNVLYLAVFCSALGYLFYIISMDVLGAGVASVFINLIPVVSVVASFFILGERLSPLQLGGAAVAVAGVYLTTMKARKPRPETVPT